MKSATACRIFGACILLGLTPVRQVPPVPARVVVPKVHGYVWSHGAKIFYAQFGSGAVPVVLLEGGGDTIDDWGFLITALMPKYRVIALDFRCQGRSTCSPAALSYDGDAADVLAVLDRLGIGKAAIVGFSDGAIVGLEMAIRNPQRVRGVFAHGANSSPSALIYKESAADAAVGKALDRVWRRWYAAESPNPAGYDAMQKRLDVLWRTQPHLSAAQLRSIRVPVWITDGDREEGVKRSDTDFLAASIPTASEAIFPDGGHYVLWSQHRLFNDAVQEFLSRLSRP